ncbi:MAG TPA: TadE/TadG family type IV pilus assembly protein [Candidimonas sp.]|nr:TadE/TadG family type IV pilus assembly protein [Candidimonas sp.]
MFRYLFPPIQPAGWPGRPVRRLASQTGTGIIEFSIAAVPVLLLGLGSIELGQWLFHKQAVSLALLEAGRAAITSHAKPAVIEAAFEQALLPLFATSQSSGAQQRLYSALQQRSQSTGTAPWRIEILSPTPQAFMDFSDSSLAIARETGLAAINNNYLAEQDQRNRNRGNGLGPLSGQSILQANTLVLRVTYLHEPVLPGMKGLLRMLGNEDAGYGQHAMARGGYLPLVQEIMLTMQSHPVNWPLPASGKVVGYGSVSTAIPLSLPAAKCQGLWCLDQHATAIGPGTNPAPDKSSPPDWQPPGSGQGNGPSGPPLSGNNGGNMTGPEQPTVQPNDPACGVALCCTVS